MSRKSALIPLLLITAFNVIMALELQLYADEAYYWMYSRKPDWGYFDHPPMVAMLIKTGYWLSDNELGVRLLFVLLATATYYLIFIWVKPDRPILFWLILFSLFPLHLLGFMALPDMPLLFFSVLFFLTYGKYLERDSFQHSLILSLAIVGMLYSKYHGGLIVLFTLISNPRLFRRSSFYLTLGLSVVFFLPHIFWLITNDFVSIRFHLFERASSGFRFTHVAHYLIGFFLFNGPLLFPVLAISAFRKGAENLFGKALRYNLVGFFIFFFLSSFGGRVEANWTLPVLVPAFVLGYPYLTSVKVLRGLSVASLVLIVAFRVYLMFPVGESRALEFHGHREFAREVKSANPDLPIVATRYQEASLLSFYLGEEVLTIPGKARKSQFDLWRDEGEVQEKEAVVLERTKDGQGDIYHPHFGWYKLKKRHPDAAF